MSSERVQDIICLLIALAVAGVVMSLFIHWFGRPTELQATLIGLPTVLATWWGLLWLLSRRSKRT